MARIRVNCGCEDAPCCGCDDVILTGEDAVEAMQAEDDLYGADADSYELHDEEGDCDDSDDGQALASAGRGTDEDYGYYGDGEDGLY